MKLDSHVYSCPYYVLGLNWHLVNLITLTHYRSCNVIFPFFHQLYKFPQTHIFHLSKVSCLRALSKENNLIMGRSRRYRSGGLSFRPSSDLGLPIRWFSGISEPPPLSDIYLPKLSVWWRSARDACLFSIFSGGHWQIPAPYKTRYDKTTYHRLFPPLRQCSRQQLCQLPFHCLSNMATTSSIQVSPVTHRHVIPPYPGLTSDVMLMSCTKRHQNPIFHIFSRKITIFSHFYWSIAILPCMLFYVVCPPTQKFNSWAIATANSSTFNTLSLTITRYLPFFSA